MEIDKYLPACMGVNFKLEKICEMADYTETKASRGQIDIVIGSVGAPLILEKL